MEETMPDDVKRPRWCQERTASGEPCRMAEGHKGAHRTEHFAWVTIPERPPEATPPASEGERFPDRVVLGEGWPVVDTNFFQGISTSCSVGLYLTRRMLDRVNLKHPKWVRDDDCPKYRLVLERVGAEELRSRGVGGGEG